MQIATQRLGQTIQVEVTDADRIRFDRGLVGFEEIQDYALLPDPEGGILWLHALTDASVSFPLIDPFLVWPDYDITIPDADAEELGIAGPQDVQALVVVTPRQDASQITANLRAPIVINLAQRVARQIILPEATYAVRAPVLSALAVSQGIDDATPAGSATETDIDRAAA